MSKPSKLVVVGQGYVGLPLAMRAVEVGFDVVGFDIDKRRISSLAIGESFIDDISDDEVRQAIESGRYLPSETEHALIGFDYAIVTVPTPLRDGQPDITYIERAVEALGRHLTAGSTVVLESTTYPGTTEEIVGPILEHESGLQVGVEFHLGYSPERIDPGNEVWTFQRTPKVISGIDESSLERVTHLYNQLVDRTVPVKGTREAELTKLLENTYRHVNIALVNELAMHAQALGIDFWNVIEGASTKPFGFMPFYPGPGVGGHCLPVDPSYLSWKFERQLGSVSRFVKIADNINNAMPGYVVSRVQAGLNQRRKPMNGSCMLVIGLAYKRNSSDSRETPATDLIRRLLALGCDVHAHDTHVSDYELDEHITRVDPLSANGIAEADAVIVLTDHDSVDYDLIVDNASYVFDTRHRLTSSTSVETL